MPILRNATSAIATPCSVSSSLHLGNANAATHASHRTSHEPFFAFIWHVKENFTFEHCNVQAPRNAITNASNATRTQNSAKMKLASSTLPQMTISTKMVDPMMAATVCSCCPAAAAAVAAVLSARPLAVALEVAPAVTEEAVVVAKARGSAATSVPHRDLCSRCHVSRSNASVSPLAPVPLYPSG